MSEDELHRSDTVEEKLSLAKRFGVTIGYYKPNREEYFNIVTNLARRHPEIKIKDEELRSEAVNGKCVMEECQGVQHSSLSIHCWDLNDLS